jgi:DNA-binding CsgD family transcriptional regulator
MATMAHRISDHRRHRLSVTDVRALLRLCNDLHGGSPDPEARKRRLLEGLRRLIEADHASAVVAAFSGHDGRRGAKPAVISLVHAGAADTAPVGHPEHDGLPWAAYRGLRRRPDRRTREKSADRLPPDYCTAARASRPAQRGAAGGGDRVHSFLPQADDRLVACLTVARAPGSPRFSPRERSMVCALHAEAEWVYRAELVRVSPATRGLSPRQLDALRHLLTGKSEKQIAADLGVSYNTLHHYVKALYRHFGVTSRIEMLARWAGK